MQTAGDVATALELAGTAALRSAAQRPGPARWQRPGPDAGAARSAASTLPGIALSGYGQEQDVQQSREAGFAAHLTKPVDLTRLEEAVAALTAASSPGEK